MIHPNLTADFHTQIGCFELFYDCCVSVVDYSSRLKTKCRMLLESNDALANTVEQQERKLANDARGARNLELHFQVLILCQGAANNRLVPSTEGKARLVLAHSENVGFVNIFTDSILRL